MSEHHQPHALATTISEEDGRYLEQACGDLLVLHTTPASLTELAPDLLSQIEILLPFIHPAIGASQLEMMPRLRLIATRSTGYDHIDLEAARARNVQVANVPGYGETAVAEHTFALMLAVSRKIVEAATRTRRGDYLLDGLQGFDLYGKTLGVVGVGAIGLHVIRIARGFGMKVVATDVIQHRLLAEVLDFRYVELDELLSGSDIVSLHAPALASTQHMINHETLARMKPGTLLINTARGSLVETEALSQALERGHLAGAGLDALEGEELLNHEEELLHETEREEALRVLLANRRLQRLPQVVITPHIAFNTHEALHRILDTTVENVRAFLRGAPEHLVAGTRS